VGGSAKKGEAEGWLSHGPTAAGMGR
jgi:hypothetical protein